MTVRIHVQPHSARPDPESHPVTFSRLDSVPWYGLYDDARLMSMTIGQLAKDAGIGVETIRFHERNGLITQPRRPASGYRKYDDDLVDRLRFIQQAKELGFTLNEIKDLLSLRVNPRTSCAETPAAFLGVDQLPMRSSGVRKMPPPTPVTPESNPMIAPKISAAITGTSWIDSVSCLSANSRRAAAKTRIAATTAP